MGQRIYQYKNILAIPSGRPSFLLPEGFEVRGEWHLTLVDPIDTKLLKERNGWSNRDVDLWLKKQVGTDIPGYPKRLGIGHASKGGAEAYYEVIEWPEAQEWRKSLGLGPKDLHITVGFKGEDPHGVPKGKATLISSVDSLVSEIETIARSLE